MAAERATRQEYGYARVISPAEARFQAGTVSLCAALGSVVKCIAGLSATAPSRLLHSLSRTGSMPCPDLCISSTPTCEVFTSPVHSSCCRLSTALPRHTSACACVCISKRVWDKTVCWERGKKPAQLAWCLLNCGAWCPPMGDVWDPCLLLTCQPRGLTYKDPCLTCWPSVALSCARIVTSESLLGGMYITNPKVVTWSRAACRQ
jgi:hypothetical protein